METEDINQVGGYNLAIVWIGKQQVVAAITVEEMDESVDHTPEIQDSYMASKDFVVVFGDGNVSFRTYKTPTRSQQQTLESEAIRLYAKAMAENAKKLAGRT